MADLRDTKVKPVTRDSTPSLSALTAAPRVTTVPRSTAVPSTVAVVTVAGSFAYAPPSPSATWTIPHTLGKYPVVTVVDPDGNQVWAEVRYDSLSQVTVLFGEAFLGIAYLS